MGVHGKLTLEGDGCAFFDESASRDRIAGSMTSAGGCGPTMVLSWRVETFNVSNDPRLAEKLVDVVGLYFVRNSNLSNRVTYFSNFDLEDSDDLAALLGKRYGL